MSLKVTTGIETLIETGAKWRQHGANMNQGTFENTILETTFNKSEFGERSCYRIVCFRSKTIENTIESLLTNRSRQIMEDNEQMFQKRVETNANTHYKSLNNGSEQEEENHELHISKKTCLRINVLSGKHRRL